MAVAGNHIACQVLLVGHGARADVVNFGDFQRSVETAVAVGGSQFIKVASFDHMPCDALRAIMWRSPSLQRILASDGSVVTRDEDGLAVRPAVQRGDRVRVLDSAGDWELASVVGDSVELYGREGAVPIEHLVFAGSTHLA